LKKYLAIIKGLAIKFSISKYFGSKHKITHRERKRQTDRQKTASGKHSLW